MSNDSAFGPIRLPSDLLDKLREIAANTDRSVAQVVRQALRDYAENYKGV